MIDNNDFLQEIKLYKRLEKSTYKRYKTNINEYSTFNGMSMHELIEEAEHEEEIGIILRKRKIKQRLTLFQDHLTKKNLQPSSIISKMAVIKATYRFHEITIPKLPVIKNINYETINDIVTADDIKTAILNSKSTQTQAMILFMASSGTATNETSRITIHDFIKATEKYHNQKNCNNIRNIIEILKERSDVVPTFHLIRQKTNYPYYTFCTPEATKKIIQMLEERYKYREYDENDLLFDMSTRAICRRFSRLNDKCGFGWKSNRRFFHAHNLRKYFVTTCFNEGLDYITIDFMCGHKLDAIKEAYVKASPEKQKKKYIAFMDNLTFFDKVTYDTITSKEKQELLELREYKIKTEARIVKLEQMLDIITDINID